MEDTKKTTTTTKEMSNAMNSGDPIGFAIQTYAKDKKPADIVVKSDICDDDIIPVEVLFRSFEEMPELEKVAISACKGKVLDVGAGTGIHAQVLSDNGHKVKCIDLSPGAVNYMKSVGLNAEQCNFFNLKDEKYDTLLFLMNGLGIAGRLNKLEMTLLHAKGLLENGGKMLCDSSDIRFIYEEEDGSLWTDLNSDYYGNFRFQMKYKKETSPWFDWLYVDFDSLHQAAENVGMKAKRIYEHDDHYLAEITVN